MNKKLLIAAGVGVIVVALAILVYAFQSKLPQSPNTPQSEILSSVSCGVPAAGNVAPAVTIHMPLIDQHPIEVSAGQTVRWINDSPEALTMRSAAVAQDKECGGIGQPVLKPGETWQLTFLRPGTWHFAVRGVAVGVVEVK